MIRGGTPDRLRTTAPVPVKQPAPSPLVVAKATLRQRSRRRLEQMDLNHPDRHVDAR